MTKDDYWNSQTKGERLQLLMGQKRIPGRVDLREGLPLPDVFAEAASLGFTYEGLVSILLEDARTLEIIKATYGQDKRKSNRVYAKLTKEDVMFIRTHEPSRANRVHLAEMFHCTEVTVADVWKAKHHLARGMEPMYAVRGMGAH